MVPSNYVKYLFIEPTENENFMIKTVMENLSFATKVNVKCRISMRK